MGGLCNWPNTELIPLENEYASFENEYICWLNSSGNHSNHLLELFPICESDPKDYRGSGAQTKRASGQRPPGGSETQSEEARPLYKGFL